MPSFILGPVDRKLEAVAENVVSDMTTAGHHQARDDLFIVKRPEHLNESQPFLSLQLNSEYRSTYQWHEFKSKSAADGNSSGTIMGPPTISGDGTRGLVSAGIAAAPSSLPREEVIKRQPRPILNDDFNFSRKKKHPDVAYRSHEFFDTSLVPSAFPSKISASTEVIEKPPGQKAGGRPSRLTEFNSGSGKNARNPPEGGEDSFREQRRRAQSEGPSSRRSRFARAHKGEVHPSIIVNIDLDPTQQAFGDESKKTKLGEILNQPRKYPFAPSTASLANGKANQSGGTGEPRPGTETASNNQQLKESASLGRMQSIEVNNVGTGQTSSAAGGLKSETKAMSVSAVAEPPGTQDPNPVDASRKQRSEYKSEYRKSFKPFSHYEYVGGRFVPISKNPSEVTGSLASVHVAVVKGGPDVSNIVGPPDTVDKAKGPQPSPLSQQQHQKAVSLYGEPWYNEVIELRKMANDYKCRGWGVETAQPHMNDLYNKQLDLFEVAAKRANLSALSLAFSTPRSEATASSPQPPEKTASLNRVTGTAPRSARPSTAPASKFFSKTSRSESVHPPIGTAASSVPSSGCGSRDSVNKRPTASGAENRAKSSGPVTRARSPTKRISRQPSASTASSSVAPSPKPVLTAQEHKKSDAALPDAPTSGASAQPPVSGKTSAAAPFNRRQRPTTLETETASSVSNRLQQPTRLASSSPSSSALAAKQRPQKPPNPAAASKVRHQGPKSQKGTLIAPGPTSAAPNSASYGPVQPERLNQQTIAAATGVARADGKSQAQLDLELDAQLGSKTLLLKPSQGEFSRPSAEQRRTFSRSSSRTAPCTSRDGSRPPSAFENNLDYFKEPVVKSPPEPTRVKSPESVVKSPDPINWTVPLDTGKTFSVTQSVRDGDSPRNSPMSDRSAMFDSVSGTAISLGGKGSNPKISSLAKDARDIQAGPTKDSTITRPSFNSVHNNCVNADGHQAIPEVAEETSPAGNMGDLAMSDALSNYTVKDDEKSSSHNGVDHVPPTEDGAATDNGEVEKEALPPRSEDILGQVAPKPVLGTTLKCLEDPSFAFDSAMVAPKPKKPTYRVLEDPTCDLIAPQAPAAPPAVAATATSNAAHPRPTYKVLEDPMLTSLYTTGPMDGNEQQSQ